MSPPNDFDVLKWPKKGMQQQKAAFLQATAGVVHQPSRKFRMLNERVVRAVATYGQSEILVYLRSIAHLSHSEASFEGGWGAVAPPPPQGRRKKEKKEEKKKKEKKE